MLDSHCHRKGVNTPTDNATSINIHTPNNLDDIMAESVVMSKGIHQGLTRDQIKGLLQIHIANRQRGMLRERLVNKVVQGNDQVLAPVLGLKASLRASSPSLGL